MHTVIALDTLPATQAEHILFLNLFNRMLADTPRIPVTPFGMTLITSWRDEILVGGVREHAFGTWGQLFENIRWNEGVAGTGPFCGAAVFQFLGYFGEAMQRFGPTTMPLQVALMALIRCQAEQSLVALTVDDEDRWSVCVTSRGTAILGLVGRISFAERAPLFDVPQELFENYYSGELVTAPARYARRQAL